MADAEATAVLKVRADVRQAVDGIKGLEKAQHQLKRAVEDTGSSFSKFIDRASDGLAKFNLAMGGIEKGLGYLKTGLDIAKEVNSMERLERALPTHAVERLSKASQGLIDRHSQLRLGVKGMTGDFALTEIQMEKVIKASIALEQKGFGPAAQTADKLLEALAQGVNKLDDFGINLEKTKDRQADVNAAMEKFDELIRDNPVDERTASMGQLQQAIEGVTLVIKDMIATVVNGLASLNAALPAGYKLGDLIKGGLTGGSVMSGASGAAAAAYERYQASTNFGETNDRLRMTLNRDRLRARYGEIANTIDGFEPEIIGRSPPRGPATEYVANVPRPYGGAEGLGLSGSPDMFGTPLAFLGLQDPSFAQQVLGGTGIGRGGMFGAGRLQFDQDPMAKLRGKAGTALKDFGLDVAADQIGAAASAMSSAMTAALEAAISGSEGIGKAARKASAAVLKALAVESAGRAVYMGAIALGSLAIGRPDEAAAAGAAAAKFAIAAAVTGAGAAALGSGTGVFQGGGGGGAQAPAGGGFSRAPTAGQNAGGGTNITINFGDGFVGDQRQVADLVAKAVKDSQRRGGTRDSSVRFDG